MSKKLAVLLSFALLGCGGFDDPSTTEVTTEALSVGKFTGGGTGTTQTCDSSGSHNHVGIMWQYNGGPPAASLKVELIKPSNSGTDTYTYPTYTTGGWHYYDVFIPRSIPTGNLIAKLTRILPDGSTYVNSDGTTFNSIGVRIVSCDCVRRPPTLEFSGPSFIQLGIPQNGLFAVKVNNNDSVECGVSTFSQDTRNIPTGWIKLFHLPSGWWSTASIQVEPQSYYWFPPYTWDTTNSLAGTEFSYSDYVVNDSDGGKESASLPQTLTAIVNYRLVTCNEGRASSNDGFGASCACTLPDDDYHDTTIGSNPDNTGDVGCSCGGCYLVAKLTLVGNTLVETVSASAGCTGCYEDGWD